MPGLIWTASALRDLTEIDRYLGEQGASDAAIGILVAIQDAAERLSSRPRMGRMLSERLRLWRITGTRYVLLYSIVDDGVAVVRVLHERRDRAAVVEQQP